MTSLYVVRHGEDRANSVQVFSPKYVDFPLTSKRALQARRTADDLNTHGVDWIHSSPPRRAVETAKVIGGKLSVPVDVEEIVGWGYDVHLCGAAAEVAPD